MVHTNVYIISHFIYFLEVKLFDFFKTKLVFLLKNS